MTASILSNGRTQPAFGMAGGLPGAPGINRVVRANGQVKVLESYLAPTDFTIGELAVRKGTWLLAVRVLSDELWERVKSGDLTRFSIGGSARRGPGPPPLPPSGQPPNNPAPPAGPTEADLLKATRAELKKK